MNVLVTYASRHGATGGIAERVAAVLREAGVSAEVCPVAQVGSIDGYDAFVIGAAAYMFHWLKDATRYVKRHHKVLAERPVWLFSSGPLGTDLVDEQGRDVLEVTRPKEFDEFHALVHPRGGRVFFGAWVPDAPPVGLGERFVRCMSAAPAIPAGDFRDWPAIEGWAADTARELRTDAATAAPGT
jgi:menaquinone-dependent protoporphyrinogen oxidase